jgi:predicted nuclease of restriction endonuclease-like (RecB) superfamily
LKRDFYAELCRLERWSVRQLQERLQSLLFERSALSRQPEETIRHELQALRQEEAPSPALLLKDPYVLDFLGLNDRYLERDLEDAILRELEQFLLELGAGWPGTNKRRARTRRWASSCARARSRSRSNCWSWTRAASTWPST